MSDHEVDAYLAGAPEPHRSTLAVLRALLAELLPGSEQGIAYGVPCFRLEGTAVAGFGHSKGHCTYFPMSGCITTDLADELQGYETAKGSIRFPPDQPLPPALVGRLVDARVREIRASRPS